MLLLAGSINVEGETVVIAVHEHASVSAWWWLLTLVESVDRYDVWGMVGKCPS